MISAFFFLVFHGHIININYVKQIGLKKNHLIILVIAGKARFQQQKWQKRVSLPFQLWFVHLNSSVNINQCCCSAHYLFFTVAVYHARI